MKKLLSWAKKLNPAIYIFTTVLLLGIGFSLWRYSVMGISFSSEDHDFWNGVFTEFHGFLLDVLLFGLVLTIYDRYRDKKERVQRWMEEIGDYRGWDEKEAMYRIKGNIKRLNRERVKELNLSFCYLQGAKLQEANLQYANLQFANLQGAILREANLQFAKLQFAKLQDANLQDANLQYANLQDTNLQDTNLQYASLQYAKLQGAFLREANLQFAKLQGAMAAKSQREDLITAGVTGEILAQINWFPG